MGCSQQLFFYCTKEAGKETGKRYLELMSVEGLKDGKHGQTRWLGTISSSIIISSIVWQTTFDNQVKLSEAIESGPYLNKV